MQDLNSQKKKKKNLKYFHFKYTWVNMTKNWLQKILRLRLAVYCYLNARDWECACYCSLYPEFFPTPFAPTSFGPIPFASKPIYSYSAWYDLIQISCNWGSYILGFNLLHTPTFIQLLTHRGFTIRFYVCGRWNLIAQLGVGLCDPSDGGHCASASWVSGRSWLCDRIESPGIWKPIKHIPALQYCRKGVMGFY